MADMTSGPARAPMNVRPRAELRAPARTGQDGHTVAPRYAAPEYAEPRYAAPEYAAAPPYAAQVSGDGTGALTLSARLARLTHYSGAIVSVVLLAGMAIWGYKLVVRDVTGIPVVRAAQTAMREAPMEPGGNLTLNTGLAVNAVAALGQAEAPEDRLMLAPATFDLTEEDLLVQPTAEMGEVMADGIDAEILVTAALGNDTPITLPATGANPEPVGLSPDQPMTADEILALADQIAAGAAPLSVLADGVDAPVALSIDGADAVAQAVAGAAAPQSPSGLTLVAADVPGVARALRPPSRPAGLVTLATTAVAATTTETGPASAAGPTVSQTIPVDSTLVQLGAYETAEIAAAEWATLSGRFAEFMTGKQRVIQEASSGGRQFYRLRAMGFADFDDAGRFCAALVAEGALCIPVAGG